MAYQNNYFIYWHFFQLSLDLCWSSIFIRRSRPAFFVMPANFSSWLSSSATFFMSGTPRTNRWGWILHCRSNCRSISKLNRSNLDFCPTELEAGDVWRLPLQAVLTSTGVLAAEEVFLSEVIGLEEASAESECSGRTSKSLSDGQTELDWERGADIFQEQNGGNRTQNSRGSLHLSSECAITEK